MIKFEKKTHIQHVQGKKIVIYYSFSEIVLGFILILLVGFFMFNYLQNYYNENYKQEYKPDNSYRQTVLPDAQRE